MGYKDFILCWLGHNWGFTLILFKKRSLNRKANNKLKENRCGGMGINNQSQNCAIIMIIVKLRQNPP